MGKNINLICDGKLNYDNLILEFPWIVEKKKYAILSPDSDGILSAIFMSHFFDWEVVGFYDGKILLLKDGCEIEKCIFLDVDIFRKEIKSIGHHMLLFDKRRIPDNWNNYENCIQPNNIRNFDFRHDFKTKYPLGTIHLLLGIADKAVKIDIPKSAICPLYFVDGTYKVLFSYPENVLEWIGFLGGRKSGAVINKVFCNSHYSVRDMMIAMDNFFRARDNICPPRGGQRRERGDRLVISDNNGPMNIVQQGKYYSIESSAKDRIEKFIKLISNLTSWIYDKQKWSWSNLVLMTFNKSIDKPLVRSYYPVVQKDPFSFAITAADRFEYTLQ